MKKLIMLAAVAALLVNFQSARANFVDFEGARNACMDPHQVPLNKRSLCLYLFKQADLAWSAAVSGKDLTDYRHPPVLDLRDSDAWLRRIVSEFPFMEKYLCTKCTGY